LGEDIFEETHRNQQETVWARVLDPGWVDPTPISLRHCG
jgi:hypothetical protein